MKQEKQPILDENTLIPTSLKTVGAMVAITAAGVAAWTWALADIKAQGTILKNHNTRIEFLESRVSADHDILLEIRGDVKALRERASK